MEIGIIGLPRSGKTTIFNAVTKGRVAVAGYSEKPNVGVAKVPDNRLDTLSQMYQPKRTVPAEITYIDIPPPPEGFGKTRGIGGEYLNALQSTDALMVVVRGFEDPSVAHVDQTIEPGRDAENMLMEMIFSDIEVLDRRLNRIKNGRKGGKPQEREALGKEQSILQRIKDDLDAGVAIRNQTLSADEVKFLSGFGFLTTKPIITVINVGEDQLDQSEYLEHPLIHTLSDSDVRATVMCAKLEMELGQMTPEEEEEFRQDLGAGESSLNQMVRLSYEVVDQINFFTVGEDEVKAWEIRRTTVAQKAAGRIHSDLERGFIRAEVISYENLIHYGGLNEAQKYGVVRKEGKEYIVKDGDILNILFNV
jgi:GTP-binding protein YchF